MTNTLQKRPGHLVRKMHQLAVGIFAQEMAAFDLTPVQFGVLSVVVDSPGIDQVSAAEAVAVDRTTIVGVVDRLVRKECLSRIVSPTDRRVRLLHPTAKGIALLAEVAQAAEAVRTQLLQPLSEAEAALFCEMMERVIAGHEAARQASPD